jgi:hypothetical protein
MLVGKSLLGYRGCRKCGGDLFLDRDEDGSYLYCLQCGAVYVLPPPASRREAVTAVHAAAESEPLLSRSRSQRFISSRAGGDT